MKKMKNILKKIKGLLPKLTKYFFDFLVVFVGVFLAFWLNERKDRQEEETRKQQIYISIYEDFNDFYLSGRKENKEGFINLFENQKNKMDSLVAIKELPSTCRIFGDYWQIGIINALIESGNLEHVDIRIFKGVTGFQTMHRNMLTEIETFNEQYEKYITANYDNEIDDFYEPGTNELKQKYKLPLDRLNTLIAQSKMLVEIAKDAKEGLNELYKIEEELKNNQQQQQQR
jgi:hypothetical protein